MYFGILNLFLFLNHLVLLDGNKIPACIFEYNSSLVSQGEVYSPNYPNQYPNNLHCRYEFYANENQRVIIQIEDFQLEAPQSTSLNEINFMDFIETITRSNQGSRQESKQINNYIETSEDSPTSDRQCFYDFVDVFTSDGLGRIIWRSRHCGTQIDSQIVSTSPTLILVFQTDRMLSFRGFKLRFRFSNLNILPFVTEPICGASEIVGNGSVLASPNYPLMFPANTECAWTITVEKHQNILIKFIDVNLNQPCHQSQVSIWDGYVTDVAKPDFIVCEKLTYYHKGIRQYKSKNNRIVIKFLGNKNSDISSQINSMSSLIKEDIQNSEIEKTLKQANRTSKQKNLKINNGFFLSWTSIHLADDCGSDFQCKGGEYCIDSKNFLCQQTYRYCISQKLVCDGVLNCDTGDESDEKHCELSFLQSRLNVSIAIIASLIFILLTIIFLIIHRVNKKHIKVKVSKINEIEQTDNHNSKSMPLPTFIEFDEQKASTQKEIKNKSNHVAQNGIDFDIESQSLGKNYANKLPKNETSCQYLNSSNSELDNEKSKSKQINEYCGKKYLYNSNEETQLLNKSIEYRPSSRISTPTCSSSLISDISMQSQIEVSNKNNSINGPVTSSRLWKINHKLLNDKANKLKEMDDGSRSFRRNSYTKAIFLENG